jgi:hypothetical protein
MLCPAQMLDNNPSNASECDVPNVKDLQGHHRAGGRPFRAAPDFVSSTTETRGVPNLFCCLSGKGSGFNLVLKVFAGRAFLP